MLIALQARKAYCLCSIQMIVCAQMRQLGVLTARLCGGDWQVVAGFSVDDAADAVPIASALVEGGIDVIELTLRTDAAVSIAHLLFQIHAHYM